jgi:hypothetical protein
MPVSAERGELGFEPLELVPAGEARFVERFGDDLEERGPQLAVLRDQVYERNLSGHPRSAGSAPDSRRRPRAQGRPA